MLDDLVAVIETLKARIRDYGDSLRQNEYRTRAALIDPLLQVLGWDVADPRLVTLEYRVAPSGNSARADYALLGTDGRLVAAIDAKRLGESLENHEKQIFDYAWNLQVKHGGLTDGNWWYFVDFSKFTDKDRTVMQVSLTDTPVHETALKLLLLWRPNLASRQPVAANEPELVALNQTALAGIASQSIGVSPAQAPDLPVPTPVEANWKPLSNINYNQGDSKPVGIRFSGSNQKQIKSWVDIWSEVCEWLAVSGKLTSKDCPVPSPRGSGVRVIVNTIPKHPPSSKNPDGNDFAQSRSISTGLFIETNYNPRDLIHNSMFLLKKQGVDPTDVELRFP